MVQGSGRPGQPNIGQRSIFGNGGPNFTQMPTYTPVTRGQQQQPAQQPAQPPAQNPAPQNPYGHQAQPQPAPAQPAPQAPQRAPSYQPQPQPQAYGGHQQYQPQAYQQPPQAPQSQPLPDLSDADPGFPDSIFGDLGVSSSSSAAADASFPESYSDHGAGDEAFDAGFPEGGDASFPDSDYAADAGHDDHAAYGGDASFEPQAPHGQPAYQPQPHGDPRRQLQAFDATYNQPPQVALGAGHAPGAQAPQQYYETDRADADFLDESQVLPPPAKSKMAATLKGRSAFMVASALLGAIALGGAIAYAYKLSGGGIDGEAPLVTADARPVKEVPDQPGGKEFPHKNKLIYDRLTNGDTPESEKLVPRQEDVAVPAMPQMGATAGLPAPVATTDFSDPAAQAAAGTDEDGGPRKVKTLRVLPDGSVETPPAEVADAAAAPEAAAAPTDAASPVMPVPAAPTVPAAPQEMAAADPAPAAPEPAAAPAADTKYVVQVGAKRNQTEALATFADIQQKYPDLLSNYRPIVQKADLGSKGVWYRLRVGPIADKGEAYSLCGQLKSKGLPDCLVMTQ